MVSLEKAGVPLSGGSSEATAHEHWRSIGKAITQRMQMRHRGGRSISGRALARVKARVNAMNARATTTARSPAALQRRSAWWDKLHNEDAVRLTHATAAHCGYAETAHCFLVVVVGVGVVDTARYDEKPGQYGAPRRVV